MATGALATVGYSSYLMVGRELTFKTYNTCTAALIFTSAKFSMMKDSKILDEISTSRTFANRIGLGRKLSGEVSFYMASDSDACQYLLQNAMGGGTVSTQTAAGDTTGAGVLEHTYSIKNFDATYSSLCMNHRKGDATNGTIWEYSGFRVDSFNLKAKIDDALMATVKLMGCDASVTSNNLSALVTNTMTQTPLDFVGMRFSMESTFNSLTAASYWHVQSIDWSTSNKLKSDADTRRIGSDVLEVIPPGIAEQSLKVSMRFDDLTAYNAMLNQTQMAVQMEFTGNTITGSKLRQSILINMPKVYIKNAGDPEVGGPDDILKVDLEFDILRDTSTTTGYALQVVARNKTTTYA